MTSVSVNYINLRPKSEPSPALNLINSTPWALDFWLSLKSNRQFIFLVSCQGILWEMFMYLASFVRNRVVHDPVIPPPTTTI